MIGRLLRAAKRWISTSGSAPHADVALTRTQATPGDPDRTSRPDGGEHRAAERWPEFTNVSEVVIDGEQRRVVRAQVRPWDLSSANRRYVADALETSDSRYVDVAKPGELVATIAVPDGDWAAFVTALKAAAPAERAMPIYVERGAQESPKTDLMHEVSAEELAAARELCIFILCRWSDTDVVGGYDSRCRVQRWQVTENGEAVAPTPNAQFSKLSLDLWQTRSIVEWGRDSRRLWRQMPSPLWPQPPVDVVYLWVDGSDPLWAARLRAARAALGEPIDDDADGEKRFRDRGELRASIRSLLINAPWFDHLYLVTDQQVPEWLDSAHPRVTVVDHTEIFGSGAALPSFNSRAIASRLHHIPGLAERYLVLNDDVFFNRPATPDLFFTGAGGVVVPISSTVAPMVSSERLNVMEAARRNSAALIERDFGRTPVNVFRHTPIPQLRSLMGELEDRYPAVFADLEKSPFRSSTDHEVNGWLHHNVALLTGRGVAGSFPYRYFNTSRGAHWDALHRLRPTSRAVTFCINDTGDDRSAELQQWLTDYFPVPSPIEIVGESREHKGGPSVGRERPRVGDG